MEACSSSSSSSSSKVGGKGVRREGGGEGVGVARLPYPQLARVTTAISADCFCCCCYHHHHHHHYYYYYYRLKGQRPGKRRHTSMQDVY